ncbi:MAG: SMI1/KNR4 family protein [Rhodospirillales bacterium]|nr:SMI1/KNR4 family protein [Rhodospirillales bacterium]
MQPLDVAIEGLIFVGQTMPGTRYPAPPPTPGQIARAEAMLGCRLPPSYVEFLTRAGMHILPDWDIYWIGDETLELRNIVVANDVERNAEEEPIPHFLIAFYDDGTGDQYCFDTRQPDEAGEYPIVLWERDKTQRIENLYVTAENFVEWLKAEVKAVS